MYEKIRKCNNEKIKQIRIFKESEDESKRKILKRGINIKEGLKNKEKEKMKNLF